MKILTEQKGCIHSVNTLECPKEKPVGAARSITGVLWMNHLPLMIVQENHRRDMERSGWQLACLPSHKFPRAASPELYL